MELRVDDAPAELRSVKVRHLLALLAWQPNEFISDEFAIARIWDESLPQSPRDALYTCASRLRHVLDGGAHFSSHSPLSRRRGGYLLSIDPQSVDLFRFRYLVGSARGAAREADGPKALELFDQALALCGRVPLSDLESSWSVRARVSLGRERLSAELERAQLALSLGRHREAVPSLYQLAEQHPLDEAIAEMLMLALYRSRRQGESLACFASIRDEMVRQLGDEPGTDLHELHGRVLRRDPSLQVAFS